MADAQLSTAQVARYLGVKTQTVYAYVSRGLLAPTRRPGSRASWFRLDEVERLRVGSQRRAAALAAGSGAGSIQTRITGLEDDDTLLFRGRRVEDLADEATPEALCGILWQAPEPLDFRVDEAELAALRASLRVLPPAAQPIDRMRLVVLLLGAGDAHRLDLDLASVRRRAARLLGAVAATLLPADHAGLRPDRDGLARLWTAIAGGDPADPAAVDLVRRILIVHADHDLATSTTAVRASATVHADLYACLLTGLSAIDSPLHGTSGLAGRLALEAAILDPAAALGAVLASPATPAGFGHPVYRHRDPRAAYLLGIVRARYPGPAEQAAAVVERGLAERRGLFPNTDWGMALATYSLGMPAQAAPILLAAARMSGWVAHTLEEYGEAGPRRRVTGLYTGPR